MKFKIGDIVTIVGAEFHDEFIGLEAEIVGYDDDEYDQYEYLIEIPGKEHLKMNHNRPWSAYGRWLKKLPPKQGTTTWEDIQQITGWVPNKQGVES